MQSEALEQNEKRGTAEDPLDDIVTASNVITFIRLLMAPLAVLLLYMGHDIASAVVFGLTAATDFVDGKIARATHTVSKLGQLLDPAVDRVLMICGVAGLLAVGRLPIWVVLLVLMRDVVLLFGGMYLLNEYHVRVPVIYPGKVATTLLFVGCAGMLLNMPLVASLGICDIWWLPGLNMQPCSWGIWFIYAGLILGVYTTLHYIVTGWCAKEEIKRGLDG